VFEIDEGVGFPQALTKFVPGHDLARTFEQSRKYLPRLLLESDSLTLPIELA